MKLHRIIFLELVKNGKSNQGKQRYLCKDCQRIFVENPERRHYPEKLRKIVLRLYTDRVEIAKLKKLKHMLNLLELYIEL
ncbi:IS1/IS1595 family N-terminal zinc-binding domain-containing protein [Persephonella sp.]